MRLALDPRNQLVRTPAQEEKLAQALARYFGEPVRLEFQTCRREARDPGAGAAARLGRRSSPPRGASFEADPGVQGLRERFGATRAARYGAAGKMNSHSAARSAEGCTHAQAISTT